LAKVYDLSHKIENGMTFFPGDPRPRIVPCTAAPSPWAVSELHLGTHTGTHIDAASHFVSGGKTIDQYPLERFVLPGIVVSLLGLGDDQPVEMELLKNVLSILPKGGAIVIRTDWDQFWGTDRYMRNPYLTPEAARDIVSAGAGLVGIDALNVDSTSHETCHAHDILLGNDVLIVENITGLSQLQPGRTVQFAFLPLLLTHLDGSPVRAVAWEMERV